MKRCSTWLIIKEINIETRITYHLITTGMAIIRKIYKEQMWE